jgi:cytochrome P450
MTRATLELFREISESFMAKAFDDPFPIFAECRRESPVMEGDILVELGLPSYTAEYEQRAYTLFRYEDVVGVLRDQDTYSNSIWRDAQARSDGKKSLLAMDGQEHRAWRALLQSVFTMRSLRQWEEEIFRPVAQDMVAELAPAGKADLLEFAFSYPLRAIYQVIGLDDEFDDYERFQTDALSNILGFTMDPDLEKRQRVRDRALAAERSLLDELLIAVKRKRAEGAGGLDLIDAVIRAEFEGRPLDDAEITNFVRTIVGAGSETTTRQFLNTFSTLLQRPKDLDRIREDRRLLLPALIEGERFEPPPMVLPRVATSDVVVSGTPIAAGSPVLLVIGSANRDEEVYPPDPDAYRIGRKGPIPLAFGFGTHICPGMNTSRREVAVLMEAILDGLPNVRLDPDAPPPLIRGVHLRAPSALHVVWD